MGNETKEEWEEEKEATSLVLLSVFKLSVMNPTVSAMPNLVPTISTMQQGLSDHWRPQKALY